tara:strand:- start:30492 stop:31040 length:549 start_codon:yes stop_codon:yes gene_type:complete
MLSWLCRSLLKLNGWTYDPWNREISCVIIVAPHTSNWDFIVGYLYRCSQNINPYFLAKSELFIPIFGQLLRSIGGIAVDRSQKNKQATSLVSYFQNDSVFQLVITPEGTRSQVTRWKTGFFYIAREAKVPIIPIGLDFKRKHIKVGTPLQAVHLNQTLTEIFAFYRPIEGKYPQKLPDINQT